MKNINIFRYKVNYWDTIEEKDKIDYGFAYGKNMGDAVNRICSIYTPKDGKCEVIDMHIYEIDSYDVGILTDETINETREEEK